MGFLDRFFKKQQADLRSTVQQSIVRAMGRPNFYSGRETAENISKYSFWYQGIISRNELRQKEIIDKLKIVRDINPDASMAIWNLLRLSNQKGHELEAVNNNGRVDKSSTQYLNDIAARMGVLYGGGTDQLINVLLLSAYTQGAIALEVELNDSLTEVVDFHALDPFSLDYLRDSETGELLLAQKQTNGEYKILNREQVFYYPIDPDISDPYGRSPLLPVLQIVFFQAEVLRDLQKVIHHQGHTRFDIKVVEEAIINNLPMHIKSGGPEEIARYVSSYIADIQGQMSQLEADDDFFHTDSVEISMVGGSATSSGSVNVKAVIDIINQQMVTALKQLPILLGRNEGTTETHGTIQWQIYVSGIESIQRAIKRVLERAYGVALQIKGKQLRARLEFHEIAVNDRLKEAQAEQVETNTKIQQVNQGWVSNDEAALDMVGHEAVDEPKQPISSISVKAKPQEDEEVDDEAEQDRIIPFEGLKKKSKTRNDFLIGDVDLEDMVNGAKNAFYRLLKYQRNLYIKRLEEAGNIPSRMLTDVFSLKGIYREEKPEPSKEFEKWVEVHILKDSDDQIDDLEQLTMQWISDTMLVVGSAALDEIVTGMDFTLEDRRVLRWLSDRSRRDAELIQGVSDEDVIMKLWDVVYEGQYSIKKASEALRESYTFSESRANTIARTEIISAGRSGQYFADVQSGIVIGKKWRAAKQERTREGHREADGQVVPLEDPFYVANGSGQLEALLFPGDTSLGASASNVIQCRCFYTRILEGEELK